MMLDQLQQDVTTSLKKGDAVRVETIRFLLAAVQNFGIAKYGAEVKTKITDADVLEVVKKQLKTHRESVEAFTKAGRVELAKQEKAQLAILSELGPKELTDTELQELLAPLASVEEPNFGKLMGLAMAKVAGRADGARVSAILRSFKK